MQAKAKSKYKYSCTLRASRCTPIQLKAQSLKPKANTNTAARFTLHAARQYKKTNTNTSTGTNELNNLITQELRTGN